MSNAKVRKRRRRRRQRAEWNEHLRAFFGAFDNFLAGFNEETWN